MRVLGLLRLDLPMRVLVCLLLLGAITGLCQLLPRTRQERPFGVAMLVLGGFILAEGGLSVVIVGLGLVPNGPFHDLLHELADYNDDRPVVLLIGSSFTERGIDPGALSDALANSGRAPAVQRLAVGGAPHLERLYYMKEYLARAKRKPKLVLFEIAG